MFRWFCLALCLGWSLPAWCAASTTGESNEIRFTSAAAADLAAKATSLGSPVAIYEYLRNNYDFSLYHGARSGSINTFLGGRGNDVDLAATLIAMLRSRGIPARYVVGTVRLPAPQVMNWLAVENADLAYGILRNQGIQGVVLAADKSTLDFEHVWVEALVPYTNYRGAGPASVDCVATPASCNWVPLDPSFKQRKQQASGLDPYSALSFDYTSYYNALKNNDAARRDKNPLEIYEEQVLAWLRTTAPGKTLEDIPDFTDIVAEEDAVLPASLPFATLGSLRRYNAAVDHDAVVPASEPKKWMKYVTAQAVISSITLGSATVSLVDAATQRFTFTYDTSSGIREIFRIGGAQVGTAIIAGSLIVNGQPVILGTPFSLVVSMDGAPAPSPGGTDETISATYSAVVGGYYLIATGGETSNWSQVHRAAQQLLAANQQFKIVFKPGEAGCDPVSGQGCTPYVDTTNNGWDATDPKLLDSSTALDAMTGGLLYVAGSQYYAAYRDDLARLDSLNKVKSPISGFLGVVSTTHQAEYIDGTAFSVLPGGLLIDMKGIHFSGTWRIDQPALYSSKQFELIGHIGSSLEHETWQQLTGYDAISTVRGIQMAMANGATLVNPLKNTTSDTAATMYTGFGFGAVAPTGFALAERPIYTTRMAAWSYPTTDGTQQFVALEKVPSGTTDSRLARLTYKNDGLNGGLNCFYSVQNQLQSLLNTYGANAALNAGSLCISAFAAGTTIQAAINLNKSDYATYRASYVGAAFFDYLDENLGFAPSAFAFRTSAAANDAQFSSSVQGWRNDLYLRDLTQGWVEYVVPSKLSVGPNYRFGVDIRKFHDATGNVVNATYEIQNDQGIAAGGGYVGAGLSAAPTFRPTASLH